MKAAHPGREHPLMAPERMLHNISCHGTILVIGEAGLPSRDSGPADGVCRHYHKWVRPVGRLAK